MNGARQLFPNDTDVSDSAVSSTTQANTNQSKNRREPPQPPPPPLVPLNSNSKIKQLRIDNEDSDSTGNNSLASSTGLGNIGVSSTEEGDNSLTSFEGLLNGIPSIDNPMNEDSNSKDSVKGGANSNNIPKNKPLMLADLLEKKVDKDPPILNGVLGKELVDNHIEKALKESLVPDCSSNDNSNDKVEETKQGIKRSASDEVEFESKKPHLSNTLNGNANSPAPESVSSSNGEGEGTVSTAAAKLFADIAADILEDEDEEELMQQQRPQETQEPNPSVQLVQNNTTTVQQVFVDSNQQVIMTQPRIIVSQPQSQVVIPAGAQIKTQGGQTVIVQNSQQRPSVVLQQTSTGQLILPQLVSNTAQGGQYILQTGGQQGTYIVAQPQTAVVHGQPQTVLVAQTPQQQGTPAKTIIILQQQPAANTATHHQKVMVTPQGQQVVVTQVQRPIVQQPNVSTNIASAATSVTTPTATAVIKNAAPPNVVVSQSNTGSNVSTGVEKKVQEESSKQSPVQKVKVIRDLNSPFVCEWGDCQV